MLDTKRLAELAEERKDVEEQLSEAKDWECRRLKALAARKERIINEQTKLLQDNTK